MATSPKEKSGYLTKQGKTVKNWRKRWIVLKNNHLHYFKAKDDAQPLDSIPFSECSCSYALYCETKKRSCLKINTPRRTWFFAADTDEEIGQWLEALFSWGVPESREEEEVVAHIAESTNALQSIAVSVVQSSNSGSADAFRDLCRTATVRGDAFTSSVQAITKYNSSVKYSPSPNFNDFLKDIAVSSGSLRDTFLALITLAEDARDSPSDPEPRRKLMASASAISDKLTSFKKLVLDETKGLRPQLRLILYGKLKSPVSPPRPAAPASPVPIRKNSGGSSQLSVSSSPTNGASMPPLSIHTNTPTSPQLTHSGSNPSSPTSASTVSSPQLQHRKSSSPRPSSQLGSPGSAMSVTEEQQTLFDDLISMTRDLAQIMKNLRTSELESVNTLPKSGYVTAMMCVKAARDYANLHQQPVARQAILAAAGRVFVATNQLYNPLNNDEEYSTDELLRSLSQSVVALVTIALHHHNNPPPSPTISPPQPHAAPTTAPPSLTHSPSLPNLISPTASPSLYHSPSLSHLTAPPSLSGSGNILPPRSLDERHEISLPRSQSSGRLPLPDPSKRAGARHGSGGNAKPNGDANDVPALITSTDGDVNIWDEGPEVNVNVVFIEDEGPSADGELPIRGGTLNQIIKRLTNENKPELRFVKAFIITYPSFATAEVFLNKLIQRYQVPVSVIEEGTMQNAEWKQQKLLPIQLRVYNVLKLWLEHRFHDFTPPLLAKLKMFMDECMRRDGHTKLADQLQNIIVRKLAPETRKSLSIPAPSLTKEGFWKKYPGDFVLNIDEEELAKQLTLIEFATYRAIEPLEVLNQAWNKPALRHRAPNVMRMIARFNSISFWVARLIVNEERLRSRVKMMTKMLRFAQALYKENNLNSLLAVVSGLNNAAIHRLKFTQEELASKDTECMVRFGSLLSSHMGYKNYRARVHSINPPLIPYLGIYLTDLTFIEEGNPDFLEGPLKLINFKKREMTFNVISEMQQYQQEPYKFEGNDSLIAYLAELPIIESDQKTLDREHKELYDLSLLREPRNSAKSDLVS